MGITFAHNWRLPKVMVVLLIVELPLTVACLLLTGIAQDDTYRTKLWQNGADCGFNSSPVEILYSFANYHPMEVPVVWSNFLSEYNVVISVLSMFVQLVKTVMFTMHCLLPIVSTFIHAVLLALYLASIYYQAAPDMSDPAHPSPGLPWMMSKGCKFATLENGSYCLQAVATFAVVILLAALFAIHLIYSIWCCFPTDEEKAERIAEARETAQINKLSMYIPDSELGEEDPRDFSTNQRFLNPQSTAEQNPKTPRTTAFERLNGASGPPRHGVSKTVALREFFKPKPIRLG